MKQRWQSYFYKLFKGEDSEGSWHCEVSNYELCHRITKYEIAYALRTKRNWKKAIGPYDVPMEIWECLGEDRLKRAVIN